MTITSIIERFFGIVGSKSDGYKARFLNTYGNPARLACYTRATQNEAVENTLLQIQTALTGDYEPKLFLVGTTGVLVFREPNFGWGYKGIRNGELRSDTTDGFETLARAEQAARYWLAEATWDGQAEESDLIIDPNDRANFQFQMRRQKIYNAARAAGHSEDDAHDTAWYNPGRPELFKGAEA